MFDLLKKLLDSELFYYFILAYLLPFLVSKYWWNKKNKKFAFEKIIEAIASYKADALDIELQKNKSSNNEKFSKVTEIRPKTSVLIDMADSLIKVYFSKNAHKLYDKAINKTKISIENAPNTEFNDAMKSVIAKLSEEL